MERDQSRILLIGVGLLIVTAGFLYTGMSIDDSDTMSNIKAISFTVAAISSLAFLVLCAREVHQEVMDKLVDIEKRLLALEKDL